VERCVVDYRLYFHDHLGHFRSVVDLSCADDDAAKAAARELLDGQAGELWQHGRAVHVFEAVSCTP
jgi:hypothetical protein